VIVLDDSTAAVDAVTEGRIRTSLQDGGVARSTIIIAHRLSALRHADEIIVLDEGRIVERGTHAELIALGRVYAALFALQTREEPAPSSAGSTVQQNADPSTNTFRPAP